MNKLLPPKGEVGFGAEMSTGGSSYYIQVDGLTGLLLQHTPCRKGTQDEFWIPIKIPAEYVSLMPTLPENVKIKIIYGGTLTNKF